MSSPATPAPSESVRLVDAPEEGRTTATLLASLAARLTTLHFISGGTAVGSLVSGFAALGREVSKTAEGARLRRALERGRAQTNGDAIWSALRIDSWVAGLPPAPVLDHLRNDLALLLAGDLSETIELLPIPGSVTGDPGDAANDAPAFLDCTLGLWAFSRELARSVESLASLTMPADGAVVAPADAEPSSGSMLR